MLPHRDGRSPSQISSVPEATWKRKVRTGNAATALRPSSFLRATPCRSFRSNARYRFWAPIAELGGRYLRVVTLADMVTIHNAFPDRGFKR
jgi:hypothetical protein